MTNKNLIVTRVSITNTLKAMNVTNDVPRTFTCQEAGPCSSAQSAASRLNRKMGRKVYKIVPKNNGASFDVYKYV